MNVRLTEAESDEQVMNVGTVTALCVLKGKERVGRRCGRRAPFQQQPESGKRFRGESRGRRSAPVAGGDVRGERYGRALAKVAERVGRRGTCISDAR